MRQLLTESVLLSAVGGAAGVALAIWGVAAITPLLNGDPMRGFPFFVEVDWRVMLFTAGGDGADRNYFWIGSGAADDARGPDFGAEGKRSDRRRGGARGTFCILASAATG